MLKEEIYNYIVNSNKQHNIISITKEFEQKDLIAYTLVHQENGCPLPRTVLLVALKLSTHKNFWITFAPTENQMDLLNGEVNILFKHIWNSNIENKGGLK